MKPERIKALLDVGVTLLSPESIYIDDPVVVEAGCVLHAHVFLRGRTVLHQNATIHQGCDIADSEIGEGAVVRSFTTLFASSVGRECSIGPYSEISESCFGATCRFGHYSLARHCKVGKTVKIVSHCFLSHAVIESGAHLSTGVVTSNYDGFMKHPVLIMAGAFIGTGAQLIAPVRIGKGAFVAGGAIITKDVPAGALAISRALQVNLEDWATKRRTRPITTTGEADVGGKRSRYYRGRLEEFTTLVTQKAGEEDYQRFLEKHYWILGPNYEECSAKVRAGAGYVPDFVLERTDGLFEVVEIKTPSVVLFSRSKGRLVESAELKQAVTQLFDYLDYYKVHYLSESRIQSKDFRVIGGKLVIGRTRTPEERNRLIQLNERYLGITICTYDDLVTAATSLVKLIEKDDTV